MNTCTSSSRTNKAELTVGLDVGDRRSSICVLDGDQVTERCTVTSSHSGLSEFFRRPRCHVVMEVGMHSRWMSRLLEELGHRVTIANPRQVKLISQAHRKSDKRDAELLARLGRADTALLAPVTHRSRQAQSKLAILKARDLLVRQRTATIVHIRGVLKAEGHRLTKCDAKYFSRRHRESVPAECAEALMPLFDLLDTVGTQIKTYDKRIDQMASEHPAAKQMTEIQGVGPLTALALVLGLEHAGRFSKSRDVAAYFGLVPRQKQSGSVDFDMRISKTGDAFVRRCLVNAANYILGPHAQPSDLRDFGLRIASRGGKRPRQRAKVAVARKLAVIMHSIWVTGQPYRPIGHRAAMLAA